MITTLKIILTLSLLTFACGGGSRPAPRPNPPPAPAPTTEPTALIVETPTPVQEVLPEKTITEQIIIKEGETLTLDKTLFHATTHGPPILFSNGSTLLCNGTVIEETTAESAPGGHSALTSQSVFGVMQDLAGWKSNGAASNNITIRGCTIRGVRKDFNSTHQAIALGNCSNCVVDGVRIEHTRAIGIQLGGSSMLGHWAKNSKIINSTLVGVASQPIAVTNGEDIEIGYNRILNPGSPLPGAPGSHPIDLEPNNSQDRLVRIHVHDNVVDAQTNWTSGNAIQVQSTAWFSPDVRDNIIEDNVIIGGRMTDPITNSITHGIYVSGGQNSHPKNVIIRRNTITRTSCGIRVEGAGHTVEDNKLDSVGGGGIAGFIVDGSGMTIRRNSLKCSVQPCDQRMTVVGVNTIEGNEGWAVVKL